MFQHTKLLSILFNISASALFLKIFLKFRKCQPRYSYKLYSYKKEYNFVSRLVFLSGSNAMTRGSLKRLWTMFFKVKGNCNSTIFANIFCFDNYTVLWTLYEMPSTEHHCFEKNVKFVKGDCGCMVQAETSVYLHNSLFLSYLVPRFQNGFLHKTFHIKMSLICVKMNL